MYSDRELARRTRWTHHATLHPDHALESVRDYKDRGYETRVRQVVSREVGGLMTFYLVYVKPDPFWARERKHAFRRKARMARPERKEYDDFAELPEGDSFVVVVVQAKVEMSSFKTNSGGDKQVVRMIFEALEDQYTGARVWASPGFSLHPKAPLRAIAQACAPRDMTDDELWDDEAGFDTDKLPGKILRLSGEYPKDTGDDGRKFLKPKIYKRVTAAERTQYAAVAKKALDNFRDQAPAGQEQPKETAAAGASKIQF